MITISANKAFMVPAEHFAVQGATEAQLTVSVDGTTYSNYGEAFTGVKVLSDMPRGLFYKCSIELKLTY